MNTSAMSLEVNESNNKWELCKLLHLIGKVLQSRLVLTAQMGHYNYDYKDYIGCEEDRDRYTVSKQQA